jgi:hypothetical protein
MAACVNKSEIDFSKYFRTGLYTHLALSVTPTQDGETSVEYNYTYRDFGMDHALSKRFLVKPARGRESFWVHSLDDDRHHRVRSLSALHDVLFNHYRAHAEQLYMEMGVTT